MPRRTPERTVTPSRVEFLGSKARLISFLLGGMSGSFKPGDTVVDLFCGTGSVSAALKTAGAHVEANDHLYWCSVSTRAILLNSGPPQFEGLVDVLPLTGSHDAYWNVIRHLNSLEPIQGFIWRNYSPATGITGGVQRRYFTEANAGRIDAIRRAIAEWKPLLTNSEEALLISDLLRASAAVSNVAGTYGCYLKQWKPRSLQILSVGPAALRFGTTIHRVSCADAEDFAEGVTGRIVYADPPYTKRQYAAYYHLLETIATADEPNITGSTGLRPWQDKSSDWCYKRKAPEALRRLISKLDHVRHFFLSYNEDGQIPHGEILEILGAHGRVRVFELPSRRYKSSSRPHRGDTVTERLYHLAVRRRAP